jgi:hypothetical protein
MWSYQVPAGDGETRTLKLDGRIELALIKDGTARQRIQQWLAQVFDALLIEDQAVREAISGAVFEVRQGYKSKDAKRQNADIINATNAYIHQYVPTLVSINMSPHLFYYRSRSIRVWHSDTSQRVGNF